jgi:starch-binding outer membrane protein, SusD/RagB family
MISNEERSFRQLGSGLLLNFLISTLIFIVASCKKIVEVDAPFTNTNAVNVFGEDGNAIGVVTGLHAQIAFSSAFSGNNSINLLSGLSADELALYDLVTEQNYSSYYTNSLDANQATNFGSEHWATLYNYIQQTNAAIEGLQTSTTLSQNVRQQLLGECKFLRAFLYFHLVNLYGDVPLVLTTDYKLNALLARSSVFDVYKQIILDLNEAKNLLSADYLNGRLVKYAISSEERVRPTRWAALALIARTSLYMKDWATAELSSSEIIANTATYDTASLNEVFLKNSKEAIWQLQPVIAGRNTEDARTFILSDSDPLSASERPVYLSNQLLGSFEVNDQRRVPGNWVDSVMLSDKKYYFPFKYKNNSSTVTEYLMVLRLAEQYLIRAEARTHLGNINGGKSDLDVIRARAGLSPTTANDESSLLSAILHERQVELFTECANRWFDLKRTGKVDAVMSIVTPIKSNGMVQWHSYQQLYPILFADIAKNPNLTQNPEY